MTIKVNEHVVAEQLIITFESASQALLFSRWFSTFGQPEFLEFLAIIGADNDDEWDSDLEEEYWDEDESDNFNQDDEEDD